MRLPRYLNRLLHLNYIAFLVLNHLNFRIKGRFFTLTQQIPTLTHRIATLTQNRQNQPHFDRNFVQYLKLLLNKKNMVKTLKFKKMKNSMKISMLFMLLLVHLLTNAAGQEMNEDKTLSPYFAVKSNDPETDRLPLKSTSAKVNIAGVIADVTITQVYKNEGKNPLEAIYTFPASTNAAVYAMEMTIGKRTITAVIREKQKAREEYEKAKEEGERASLLEQERPNVFQMNVANIMPGDLISVRLRYTELLIPENGVYQFVYPTVVGPRYSNQQTSNAPDNDRFVASPYTHAGEKPSYDFSLDVNISAGMPVRDVTCRSHKIITTFNSASNALIRLDSSETKGGNRDFILNYSLAGNSVESGLLLYQGKDENFFLLMLQPPKNVKKEDIPPREYIFIMDISGSMGGFPIEISKKLLRNLIVNLRPDDLFNVLTFAGSSGWIFEKSMNANAENVEQALMLIDRQSGGGGTELISALRNALNYPVLNENTARSFVIATDGYVNVEKEAFDLIRKNCNKANFFAFGIGSSVNRFIIEGMARAGSGMPMIIDKPDLADEQAEKFRNYISNPVLTHITLETGRFGAYDVEPLSIPDVMGQRPVIVFGKYNKEASGIMTIKGYTGKSRYRQTVKVEDYRPMEINSAIKYLWARERIRTLDDYNSIENSEENVSKVTKLGLRYSLLTAYTSFIAVDKSEKVNTEGKLLTVQQELPMPEGVPNSAVGFDPGETTVSNLAGSEGVLVDWSSIVYHKSISISPATLANEKTLSEEIEKKILSTLNPCLANASVLPDSITVTVDALGRIVSVVFGKNTKGNEMEECISNAIEGWSFTNFGISSEWKFTIKF